MSKKSREARRERREQERAGSAVREAPKPEGPSQVTSKPADPGPAPTPKPEPLTWPERSSSVPSGADAMGESKNLQPEVRAKPGPSSVIRRINIDSTALPQALREAPRPVPSRPAPTNDSTVPAAHLLTPQPSTSPGAPPADPPTAPTRREPPVQQRSPAAPKSRTGEPGTSRRKRPQSEARRSASPKSREGAKSAAPKVQPPPAAPGIPSPRMHESRGMPASAVRPAAPVAKPPPAPVSEPKSRPDESAGTLAGFVTATRRLIDRWTGAPPEVRITLPQGDLKLFKLAGDLDDRLALQAATWILFVQAMKPDSDLTIAIDCTGGSLNAGLSLIDVLLKAKCRVRTHCARQALGIGSMILAAGNKGFRTVSRTALLTVPVSSVGNDGKTFSPSHPKALQAFSAATGRTTAQVEKEILKLKSITPKLAVKHGLADALAV